MDVEQLRASKESVSPLRLTLIHDRDPTGRFADRFNVGSNEGDVPSTLVSISPSLFTPMYSAFDGRDG